VAEGNVVVDNTLQIGQITATKPVVKDNHVYRAYRDRVQGRKSTAPSLWFLYGGNGIGSIDGVLTGNTVIDGAAIISLPRSGLRMTGNTFNGYVNDNTYGGSHYTSTQREFPANVYAGYTPGAPNNWLPDVVLDSVTVRANRYEPGRGHVIVWNDAGRDVVLADVSALKIKSGDSYEVRDALDWYAEPVATGTYTGQPIPIPLVRRAVAVPYSIPSRSWQKAMSHTLPRFGVFVVLGTSGTPEPPPIDPPPVEPPVDPPVDPPIDPPPVGDFQKVELWRDAQGRLFWSVEGGEKKPL